jgi:ABC-type dipeptide/oligopeptide/nickel transport system permease subunit
VTRLWLTRLVRLARFRLAVVLLALVTLLAVAPSMVIRATGAGDGTTSCSIRADDGSYQDRLPPSSDHWFGTDAQGCDVFSQVVVGARSSLLIGAGSGAVMAALGTLLGVIAAARGGWVDALVRRIGDVTLGIPFVVGAILLLSVLAGEQRSPIEIVVALSVLGGRRGRSWCSPTSKRRERPARVLRSSCVAMCFRTRCRRSWRTRAWAPERSSPPNRRSPISGSDCRCRRSRGA